MNTKYISYIRISTAKQGINGLGAQSQKDIISSYVKSTGSEIISEYQEQESGRKSDRPVLKEALQECKKTGATLIVAKLDRLARSVSFISNLLESDVEIKFVDFPEANKLVLHIISSISEYEAQILSQRTKLALAVKKKRGVRLGSPQNLLSNLDQAVKKSNQTNREKALLDPANRRAIAMIKIYAPQGLSLTEISNKLNEQGFTTPRGCKFNPSKVRKLMIRYSIK